MGLNDQVQSFVDAGDWLGLLGYYAGSFGLPAPSAPSLTQLAWVAFILSGILLWLRVGRLLHRPRIPWTLGGVTVDLRGGRDTLHAVVGGMSGTGKSTVVLDLLMRCPRALVVAFDNSRPIRELFESRGWTIWTPGGTIGWDILRGSAQIVSEALTAGFARSASDTGYNRGLARMRLWRTLDALDQAGMQRDIWILIEALRRKTGDADEDRACRSWSNRFESIAMSLGPSLGHDLDIGEAIRRGQKVLILPNRFLSPEDAPLVGAIALVQARRVAQEVGDFVLVVEEAGQAGARQAEIIPLSQAARDRGVPMVLLTQNMAKLPEEVVNNTSVWVSFAQETRKEVAFAVERMRNVPDAETDFDRENLPTGWCWVRAPGVRPKRVRLSRPNLTQQGVSVTDALPRNVRIPPDGHSVQQVVMPIALARPDLPALGAPSAAESDLLEGVYRDGECERWSGKHDAKGYGLVWWPLAEPTEKRTHEWQRIHRVRWELAFGPIGIDPETGKKLTIDHRRTCPRDCSRLDHLEPCTGSENSKRRWRVRGVGSAAG